MRINILITIIIFLLAGCAAKMQVKEGSDLSEKPVWAMNMGKYEKGIGANKSGESCSKNATCSNFRI